MDPISFGPNDRLMSAVVRISRFGQRHGNYFRQRSVKIDDRLEQRR